MGYAVKPLFPAQIHALVAAAQRRFARYMEIRKAAASPEAALQAWRIVQAAVEKIRHQDGGTEDDAAATLERMAEEKSLPLHEAALQVIGKN